MGFKLPSDPAVGQRKDITTRKALVFNGNVWKIRIEEIPLPEYTGVGSSYNRPVEYIPAPTVEEGDDRLNMLFLIKPGDNPIAFSAEGNYIVDWGNGIVQNFNSGSVAEHIYNFDTFIQASGGLTAEGYKQVKITVTAAAGGSITSINLHRRHSYYSSLYEVGIAELYIALPSLTSLTIGRSRRVDGKTVRIVEMNDLKKIVLLSNQITDLSFLLYKCNSLLSAELYTDQAESAANVFNACIALRETIVTSSVNGQVMSSTPVVEITESQANDVFYDFNALLLSSESSALSDSSLSARSVVNAGVEFVPSTVNPGKKDIIFDTYGDNLVIPGFVFPSSFTLEVVLTLDGHEGTQGYSIIAAAESGVNVYFGVRYSAGRYYMTIYTGNSVMERLSPDNTGFLPGERVSLGWHISGGYGSSYFKGANMNNASMGTIHTNLALSNGLRIGGSPMYPTNHRFKGKIHGFRITGPNGVSLRNLAGSNPAFL